MILDWLLYSVYYLVCLCLRKLTVFLRKCIIHDLNLPIFYALEANAAFSMNATISDSKNFYYLISVK